MSKDEKRLKVIRKEIKTLSKNVRKSLKNLAKKNNNENISNLVFNLNQLKSYCDNIPKELPPDATPVPN
jgi:hypothetical protein